MNFPRGKVLFPGLVLLAAAWSTAQECQGCDEPVFRYALSSWDTDAYTLAVYKGKALSPAQERALAFLEKASFEKGGRANFSLQVHPGPPPRPKGGRTPPPTPWMVLSYPGPVPREAWSGRLTEKNARALVDSHARRDLAELLLDGESVPWILVESGRKEADEKAASFLEKTLAALPERLRKETIQATPPGEKPREVKVCFPLYRIRRDDPSEGPFLAMLLHVKKGLLERAARGPVVFPLFGKGRILEALAGPEITAGAALRACRFLAGPCACEVKGMAPGLDMLFSTDWEKADIQPLLTEIDLPPLTGLPAGEGGESKAPPGETQEGKGREDKPSPDPEAPSSLPADPGGRGTGKDLSRPSSKGGAPLSHLPKGFGRIVLITLAVLAAALGGLAVFFLRGKGGGT